MEKVMHHYKCLLLSTLRSPMDVILCLGMPLATYAAFVSSRDFGAEGANFVTVSFMAYAVLTISFSKIGADLVQALSSSWLDYVKILPGGKIAYTGGRILLTITLELISPLLIFALAKLTTAVNFDFLKCLEITAFLLLGSIPFILAAISFALFLPPAIALPVNYFAYIPLCFLGGLWIPPNQLPEAIQAISVWVPTRYFGELAWNVLQDREISLISVKWLGLTAVFFACAIIRGNKEWRRPYV